MHLHQYLHAACQHVVSLNRLPVSRLHGWARSTMMLDQASRQYPILLISQVPPSLSPNETGYDVASV